MSSRTCRPPRTDTTAIDNVKRMRGYEEYFWSWSIYDRGDVNVNDDESLDLKYKDEVLQSEQLEISAKSNFSEWLFALHPFSWNM